MNARGIPTVAYQVLRLLSCTGGGVYTIPAWGREVPHLGYPLSWPGWGGGVGGTHPCWRREKPILTWPGVPHSCLGVPHLRYPQSGPGQGTPLSGAGQGTPHLDLAGVPLHLDLAGAPSPSDLAGEPPHLDLTRVPPCGQTDRHVLKHNLPVVVRTRSVKMFGSVQAC